MFCFSVPKLQQIILVIGMLLLVCSTYDNLQTAPVPEADAILDDGLNIPDNLVPVVPDQGPVDKAVVVEVNAGMCTSDTLCGEPLFAQHLRLNLCTCSA